MPRKNANPAKKKRLKQQRSKLSEKRNAHQRVGVFVRPGQATAAALTLAAILGGMAKLPTPTEETGE